jgi:transposase
MLAIVREDPVCRQLMSVPGVGAIVAVTFKSGVDDPTRFRRSRDVGPHFGLTPRKYQSGELDVTGSITKVGDRMVRTALYEAASVMLTRAVRMSPLKSWAMAVANGVVGERRASAWPASLASSSTGCGSMAPTSAGATKPPWRREEESLGDRAGQPGQSVVPTLGR